ncbi:MAG: preprotein translocase subunit SecE [Acidimicrobiia bacterium]|nr:preprotein translocase subunit SecE [Acidimicrobiia bacterium]
MRAKVDRRVAGNGEREVMAAIENVKASPARALDGVRGWWANSREFIAEVRNEMKRVTWPSGREVYATTMVVILVSAFFGLYLFALDVGLDRLVAWFFRQFGGA